MLPNGPPDYGRIASDLFHCKRLAIIGNQGAGKSTFAKKLGDKLHLEFVDMEWRRGGAGEAMAIREHMERQERWVIDGDYGLIDLADRVIFLDFLLILCIWRATKRALQNLRLWSFDSPRVLLQIVPKTLKLVGFLAVIFKAASRPCAGTASSWAPNEHTIILTSPKQVDALLETLNSHKRSEELRKSGN